MCEDARKHGQGGPPCCYTHPVLRGDLIGAISVGVEELHVRENPRARGGHHHQRAWRGRGGGRHHLAGRKRQATNSKRGNRNKTGHYGQTGARKCALTHCAAVSRGSGGGGTLSPTLFRKTEGTSPFQGLGEHTSALLDDSHLPGRQPSSVSSEFFAGFFLTLAQNKKRRIQKTFFSLGNSGFIKRVQKEVNGSGEPKVEDLGPQ